MFYQVVVPKEQRRLLRFLWWPDEDISKEPKDMEMTVHPFGAVSSPSTANYALKRTARDNATLTTTSAKKTVGKNFYVDDLLKSVEGVSESVKLIKEVTNLCQMGGFNLTKIISNQKEVIINVPEEKKRKNVKHITLKEDINLPTEKALGVTGNVEEDTFGFCITSRETSNTRRGMLSVLSSIYDPCDFIAPFVLKGRKIIQDVYKTSMSWDEEVPSALQQDWLDWKNTLKNLHLIRLDRCFKPQQFRKVVYCSLHHFSDASEVGYGQVSHLRLVDENENVHCSLIMGKPRVAPSKYVSIPRLELVAAWLSMKISMMIKKELEYTVDEEVFWTDSQVVLGYVKNVEKRFKIFVANRIQYILENCNPKQWFYVPSRSNHADCSSRGLHQDDKENVNRWYKGPNFLLQQPIMFPKQETNQIKEDDPEIKRNITVYTSKVKINHVLNHFEEKVSSWSRIRRVMSYILRFVNNTRKANKLSGCLARVWRARQGCT